MHTIKSRVSTGKLKGKVIHFPDIPTTRPTKSIVKESFFNTLGTDIYGLTFIECFAGSGSIGIEAISRGCKEAWFFELENDVYKVLQKNLKDLEIENRKTFLGDCFVNIPKEVEKVKTEDLYFYIDPPFNIRENQSEIYEKTVQLIEGFPKEQTAGFTIEHLSSFKFEDSIGGFSKIKSKKFGKTTLSYYQ